MKADFHCHTKNIKDGESGREPTFQQFCEKVAAAEVKLLAVTNHNTFDRVQFDEFSKIPDCELCPGIELDVQGSSTRWHLIIFCGPEEIDIFDSASSALLADKSPKDAVFSIDDVIQAYTQCDAFFLPHYHSKEPAIPEEDLQKLKAKLGEGFSQLYLEPDKGSLCVLINQGLKVLIGSDASNWNNYQNKTFTELRLPVDSFKHFKALANRDSLVIAQLMTSITSTVDVIAHPHDGVDVPLTLYREINVLFGQRGTGKTKILETARDELKKAGHQVVPYIDRREEKSLASELKVSSTEYQEMAKKYPTCRDEFELIKNWIDEKPVLFANYVNWAKTKDKNAHQKNLAVINMRLNNAFPEEAALLKVEKDYQSINSIISEYETIKVETYLSNNETHELTILLTKLRDSISTRYDDLLIKKYVFKLVAFSQDSFKAATELNAPVKTRPSTTGLFAFIKNRVALYSAAKNIEDACRVKVEPSYEAFGALDDKGEILIKTESSLFSRTQEKTKEFGLADKITAKSLQDVLNPVHKLATAPCANDDPNVVLELNQAAEIANIDSMAKFIGIRKCTVTSDKKEYTPSEGEAAMLMLQKVFRQDGDAYVLDEPELSMGNSYTNDIIRTNLNALGKRHKIVLIATHNANLAVRTKPYLSVLRTYEGANQYKTFIGNPFTDRLVNIEDSSDSRIWSDESMKILEGGSEAFYDRRDTYESGEKSS
jgi:predicted ATPase